MYYIYIIGRLKAIEYVRAQLVKPEGGGRPRPVPIEGSETIIECDAVIAAIGQKADFSLLPKEVEEALEFVRGQNQSGRQTLYGLSQTLGRRRRRSNTAKWMPISAIADGVLCSGEY